MKKGTGLLPLRSKWGSLRMGLECGSGGKAVCWPQQEAFRSWQGRDTEPGCVLSHLGSRGLFLSWQIFSLPSLSGFSLGQQPSR